MTQRTSLSLALAAALALATPLVHAQPTGSGTGSSSATTSPGMNAGSGAGAGGTAGTGAARVSRADATFVRDAAAGGMAEVALGQMATQKAANPQVRQYGEAMVRDHGQANQELMQIASGKGIQPPAQPTSQQRRDAEMLGRLSGEAFDRAYARQMVVDHRATVALFEREARAGRDPELKAFAEKLLPSLREHLTMAQQLVAQSATGKGSAQATTSPMPMQK